MPKALPPEVRDRLLDAADRLLADGGYAPMTVEALAREVGIGKGSVYLLFPSKQAVALGAIDRNAASVLTAITSIAASEEPALRRLHLMLTARVLQRFDYARSHSASLDDLLSSCRADLLERRARHFAQESRVIARVLAEGSASGELARVPPRAAAEALITATNALLPFSLSAAELGHRRTVAARTERLIRLLTAGLTAAAAPAWS